VTATRGRVDVQALGELLVRVGEESWNATAGRAGLKSSYEWLAANDTSGRRLAVVVSGTDGVLAVAQGTALAAPRAVLPYYDPPRMLEPGVAFARKEEVTQEASAAVMDVCHANRSVLKAEHLYPALSWYTDGFASPFHVAARSVGERRYLRRALVDGLMASNASRTSALLYLDDEERADIADLMHDSGYTEVLVGARCRFVLDRDESDFSKVLTRFRSDRRAAIRKERRLFEESGARVTIHEGSDAFTDEHAVLQANVRRKYGLPADIATLKRQNDVFREHLATRALTFSVHVSGELCGFAQFFRTGTSLYARTFGIDYRAVQRVPYAYFNLLFYAPIDWCLRHGMTDIDYGYGSYATKLARGCRVERLYGFFSFPRGAFEAAAACLRVKSQAMAQSLASLEQTFELREVDH
jgi:predicted N-acyltransferase